MTPRPCPAVPLDLPRLRASFPILARQIGGRPLVYLDNAATSLKPEAVIDAVAFYYRNIGANVHRGRHALSEEASEALEAARGEVAGFVGASAGEIVFTSNTTTALNLLADGLELPPDSEVITLTGDHHSTTLPWRKRFAVRTLEASPTRPLDPAVLGAAISRRTRLVVVSHASNVTGLVQPVADLCRVARERGVLCVIDAAQSAPHLRLDLHRMGCDFAAWSGHKALGPTGIGVLYGRAGALEGLRSRDLGGGTVERVSSNELELRPAPMRLEAGTPNIAGALGLAAATRFLESLGHAAIAEHARQIARALVDGLSCIRGVKLLVADGAPLPILSLWIPSAAVSVDDLATALSDRYGVMTRAGLQCTHPLFQSLGLPGGVLRVSAYLYNTLEEVHHLCRSLEELVAAFV